MKQLYQGLTIHFPLELQYICDLGMECTYSEHPSFWFEAVVPEEKADTYIGKITEDVAIKVTYENKKKKETRTLFSGYATEAKIRCENGFYILKVKALSFSAKMDIEKKSRSFFKKGVTYHDIIQAVAKDYKNAIVIEEIPSDRETDFPILRIQRPIQPTVYHYHLSQQWKADCLHHHTGRKTVTIPL